MAKPSREVFWINFRREFIALASSKSYTFEAENAFLRYKKEANKKSPKQSPNLSIQRLPQGKDTDSKKNYSPL
jgi:hypothetical protein